MSGKLSESWEYLYLERKKVIPLWIYHQYSNLGCIEQWRKWWLKREFDDSRNSGKPSVVQNFGFLIKNVEKVYKIKDYYSEQFTLDFHAISGMDNAKNLISMFLMTDG
uniref:Uncharacterized protein n=1 Tax=Cacopsylla melanoneura TaxID=428564 RepID=A0A8D9E9T7_9HEMI